MSQTGAEIETVEDCSEYAEPEIPCMEGLEQIDDHSRKLRRRRLERSRKD